MKGDVFRTFEMEEETYEVIDHPEEPWIIIKGLVFDKPFLEIKAQNKIWGRYAMISRYEIPAKSGRSYNIGGDIYNISLYEDKYVLIKTTFHRTYRRFTNELDALEAILADFEV